MPRRTVKNRNIEVILLQDDKYLGEKYEVVGVRPIFARNVLLPQNIAVLANPQNKNLYAQKMKAAVAAREKKASGLEDLFTKISEQGGITLTRKANKENVLYAKVGENDIVEKIQEEFGIAIDSHLFKLKKKFNEIGTFTIPFLYREMKKEIVLTIHAEKEEKAEMTEAEVAAEVVEVEKTKEELKAERDAQRAKEKAEKIAKLKEKYK